MPLPIFLILGIVVGWIIHFYSKSLFLSIAGGFASIPVSVWILDLIFNNPLALRFQNYAGNHACPSCHQKYVAYRGLPTDNDSIILECFNCGAIHKFDKKYKHLETIKTPNPIKAEQAGAANPHAFGTSGISPAEQARMPKAIGDT